MNKSIWILITLVVYLVGGTISAKTLDIENEVLNGDTNTKIKTYKSKKISKNPVLLIVLHGDSPWENPDYQYRFAERSVNENINLIAVGMLRPGYSDPMKRTSDGIRGKTVGDNYDESRINQIAGAITQLKEHYKASRVILAGHSGGSAITASLIAWYPDLIDHAVIVSCPCNINSWRKDMYETSNYEGFKGDLNGFSPVDLVERIAPNTEITLFVGKGDSVTKTYLSEEYKVALEKAGKNVFLQIVDGGHEIFMNSEVATKLKKIVAGYNKTLL